MATSKTEVITNQYLKEQNLNIVCPEQFRYALSKKLSIKIEDIFVLGDILNRCVLLRESSNLFNFFPITSDEIPAFFFEAHQDNIVKISKKIISYSIEFENPQSFLKKITTPAVKLISLYHPENFPLPRFPLGISDIASAIRKKYLGKVSLCDMQFNKSISDVICEIRNEQPDIIGISATFGQQDLIELLLSSIPKIANYNPLIIFGGSLSTLNSEKLLEMFPTTMVGKGYGETTMQDVIKFWHGLIPKSQINFVEYIDNNIVVSTNQSKNDKDIYANPELDLLEETLKYKGVMQLESSRGCTYHCSFCPRGHKGQWSGETSSEFEKLIPFVRNIFNKYPNTNPKIFLVDEEFVGYKFLQLGVQNRALDISNLLKLNGFKFESSTRIDQVYQPNKKDTQWQNERIIFWKRLIENGLDRMLFGVESGVDSILKRFNKQATSEQNVIAIRILTTIGVPLRLTYITFDPLMTLEELIFSYEFQGRRDILLNRNNSIPSEQIVRCVHNPEYVSANSSGLCLFSEITYMLVSMESLIGSKYLELVEKAGLAREHILQMGKRKTVYQDENIGLMSLYSQKWVDRNFSLDYLLKSIIKISSIYNRDVIIELRVRIKHYSFSLLGKMIALVTSSLKYLHEPSEEETTQLKKLITAWNIQINQKQKDLFFSELLTTHFNYLVKELTEKFENIKSEMKLEDSQLIEKQIKKWAISSQWNLINDK